MHKIYSKITDQTGFFEGLDPVELARDYGTPLYVYNERILRSRCRRLKNLVTYPDFVVDYSAKANSNPALLQIVRSEGLEADAMSPGEIYMEKLAGFTSDEIFYICNNVSEEEMRYAIDEGVTVSVDSLSQLEQFGQLCPGGRVAVRFNPGVGAGHHSKVVTAGKKTKFGVDPSCVPQVKQLLDQYHLTLVGINQHIGSLFMTDQAFLDSLPSLFSIARQFPGLSFIDLGGGFGIPYKKGQGEQPLDLSSLGPRLDQALYDFAKEYGSPVTFRIEPGRYISAECSVLLGQVHAVKYNHSHKYIGCDIGFHILARPVLYDSYHEVEIYRESDAPSTRLEEVTIVGNICESGDILASCRTLPEIFRHDILGIQDAGAYGYTMSSNYNNRLRPAEILIRESGQVKLIRERETLEDLTRHVLPLDL
ncbi:diaminopimelate decarboxylase [Diplocloster modestus]|uniref:Diaminopimelate decarboxylase n=1 Tax=Diplocloster modestus TaxID=2850322 RepID=A0ABS6KAE3_9FIRM|nr:diaminopimelate decarboxylase [Diplocloster modestus]MBU9727474.1 diaminopimelate decarboxylase [Diplocloster modestus]